MIRIGLSAGFIEPLESTGLALAMEGAYQFVKLTESGYMKQSTRLLYNSIMTSFFEESIDFVAMHYLVSNRKEKFWQEARKLKRPIQMDYYSKKLKDGETVRVMTGAVIPDNSDAVIMKEMTDQKNNMISFPSFMQKNQNIRNIGEDIKKGAIVIEKGRQIN